MNQRIEFALKVAQKAPLLLKTDYASPTLKTVI